MKNNSKQVVQSNKTSTTETPSHIRGYVPPPPPPLPPSNIVIAKRTQTKQTQDSQ